MKELVLATSNPGKVSEIQALLSPIQCIAQKSLGISDAEETGLSFIENAILKARHASKACKKPALADDSGLVVPALGGQPGIYSARFAGEQASSEENIDQLLSRLKNINDSHRQAYFYCAIALVLHEEDPTPMIATGRLDGMITQERKGAHGFGYDPVFYIPKQHATTAELPPELKNKISHRAIALKNIQSQLI